jgi:hypothetical protein
VCARARERDRESIIFTYICYELKVNLLKFHELYFYIICMRRERERTGKGGGRKGQGQGQEGTLLVYETLRC